MPPTKVVSIKLPVDLIDTIDEYVEKYGFKSRSELIRQAIIIYIMLLDKMHRAEPEESDDGGLCLGLPGERCNIPFDPSVFDAVTI